MQKKLKVAIIGAGGRGLDAYGACIRDNADDVEVVAAIDPLDHRRALAREMFPGITESMIFEDWQPFVALGKVADAVIIATMEPLHAPIATKCAELGYDILLEKPMAPTEKECRNIISAVEKAGVIFAVCHELRYAPFFQKIRDTILRGSIGEVVHVQHFEDVAYWHMIHSFIRGHNHNSDKTSFMLLSKSCHDIDILRFLIGRRCLRVQSFGALKHFRKSCKPKQAGDATRCGACDYESDCPFSTTKVYLRDKIMKGDFSWPRLGYARTVEEVEEVCATSDMGLCVYECDNNVVDHQTVNLEYEDGITAGFTMSGFTEGGRRTIVQGTRGILRGDMNEGRIRWQDFLTDTWHVEDLGEAEGSINDGHGGGDSRLIDSWLTAIRERNQSLILTGPRESLETHLTTFAAERSRLNGTVEKIL